MKGNVRKRMIAFLMASSMMLGSVYGYEKGLQVQAQEEISVNDNTITEEDTVGSLEEEQETLFIGNNEMNQEDVVSGNSEMKQEDTSPGGNETKQEETSSDSSETKQEDTSPDGSETKQEETLLGGSEIDPENEIPAFDILQTEKEAEEVYFANDISVSNEFRIEGFVQESEELVYTGNRITQDMNIYFNDMLLRENVDYTLNYKNNIEAEAYNSPDAPSVTIRMRGQYTGTRTLYFSIAPRNIDTEGEAGYEQAVVYRKQLDIPKPVIYYNGKQLVKDRDFVCDYTALGEDYQDGDAYEEGTVHSYEVKGIGNFTGSFWMSLAVVKEERLNLEKADVRLTKYTYEYDGDPMIAEEVQVEYVRSGGEDIAADYYQWIVQADKTGTGYLWLEPTTEGKNAGYHGRKEIPITLVADRKLQDAVIGENWQEEITFSKTSLEQKGGIIQSEEGILAFQAAEDTEALVEGRDYTVKYKNADKIGKATVIFYGKGRYAGTLQKNYRIIPNTDLSVQWLDFDEEDNPYAVYQKEGAVPRFQLLDADGNDLSRNTDYTIRTRNNRKPGVMTLEIIGRGNYTGYRLEEQITVRAADISQAAMEVDDQTYTEKPDEWKAEVVIKDVNGKKLRAGTDYEKELIYTYDRMEELSVPPVGTIVYVTAQGKNNYADSSLTGSYRICRWSLKDLEVSIDNQIYTGREIELQNSDIHFYADKKDKREGKEITDCGYEIVEYQNNIRVGIARVTLHGTGEYGGITTSFFIIQKRQYDVVRVERIEMEEASLLLKPGESRSLKVSVYPENAENKTIIWDTSDDETASVNRDGVVTAKKLGTAVITAMSQDTKEMTQCKISVAIIPVEFFELNVSRVEGLAGTAYQLETRQIQPENANDTETLWESSNEKVATVDENGMITLKEPGVAMITASFQYSECVRKCMVWVKNEDESLPQGTYLMPQDFKEEGDTDDTASFNRAINKLKEYGYDTVYIPAGTYLIDAETSIQLKSNMNFIMSPDAVLQAVNNSSKWYDIIEINNLTKVTVSGGQIVGERYGHGNSEGEWGMGIGLYDSKNIIISDVKISDCWGDGIYIGTNHDDSPYSGCDDITVNGCILDNNRRNNLSIVSGDNITIDNCIFSNANGTAPEYGIDIETNNSDNPCENIVISNSTFSGNRQGSMGIVTVADNVTISNSTLSGHFINYAGTNVIMSNTKVYGNTYARIGITMMNGTAFNSGSEAEDALVASFDAGKDNFTVGAYNQDASNTMMKSYMENSLSPSGRVLRMERTSQGNRESGYYLNLSDLMNGTGTKLESGSTYRFEYTVRGYGQWGVKTDQTSWYPCAPQTERFATGVTVYEAKDSGTNCRLIFFAQEMTKGMSLEVDSVKIYKVN